MYFAFFPQLRYWIKLVINLRGMEQKRFIVLFDRYLWYSFIEKNHASISYNNREIELKKYWYFKENMGLPPRYRYCKLNEKMQYIFYINSENTNPLYYWCHTLFRNAKSWPSNSKTLCLHLHDYVINVFVNISLKNTKRASVANLFCFANFFFVHDFLRW